MQLDIITRIHDGENVHSSPRFVKESKQEIIYRCLRSLVKCIKEIPSEYRVKLTIVDDHSKPETLENVKKIAGPAATIVNLDTKGNGESMKVCYKVALENKADLIYFCEDDWLHFPGCLAKMLEAWKLTTVSSGNQPVSIAPGDCWWDYIPDKVRPCHIITSCILRHQCP